MDVSFVTDGVDDNGPAAGRVLLGSLRPGLAEVLEHRRRRKVRHLEKIFRVSFGRKDLGQF
jgi:hypothetical protein